MFGQHDKNTQPEAVELPVDVHLEWDVSDVIDAIDAYLPAPSEVGRQHLLQELERLDAQLDDADAYTANVVPQLRFNAPDPVVGETSSRPMVEEMYGTEFQAQVVLVKAAKHEVTAPTPETLAALRDARVALDTVRAQEGVDHPPTPRTA